MSLEAPPKIIFIFHFHLSFQEYRHRINCVATFNRVLCSVSPTPCQAAGDSHHYPPLPYQLGIFFFFFFTLTYCSSCKWYSACPGVQTLVCLSCSPRQHILLFKAFPRKEKQEAKFIPQLNLPVTNCTHGCRAMS